jgi:hypothetical protein
VTTFQQVARVHEFLTAHCVARDRNDEKKLRELQCKIFFKPDGSAYKPDELEHVYRFRTAIVDSLTEVDQYSLYKLRGLDQSQLLDDAGDIDALEWKGYGKNNEMVKMLCRAFRDLPMHVLFACAVGYVQDERKQFHYSPAMTGKLATQVQGMVDLVGFLAVSAAPDESGALPRRLFIQPGEIAGAKFDAKNRRAVYTQPYFDNPTMDDIMRQTGMLK